MWEYVGIAKSCNAHLPVFMVIDLIIKIALASQWRYIYMCLRNRCLNVWC